jgi:hypothetical protein
MQTDIHPEAHNPGQSTGPRTEEGKNRSRMNARKHGLTGQFYALSEDDLTEFDKFCAT